jgi:hypothetical protein
MTSNEETDIKYHSNVVNKKEIVSFRTRLN